MAFDGLSACATSVADRTTPVTARTPEPTAATRVGLGAMMFTTGVHRLLDPLSWSAYVIPWPAPVLAVSPVTLVLTNGVPEIDFGAAIVADHCAALVSAIIVVSLSTACLYLVVVFVVEDGLFNGMLARDTGLAGPAQAMLIGSLRRPIRTP